MAFEPLEFTKSWENSEDFPTYEPDERQVRADLQLLHEETRQGLNRLIAALNSPDAAAQLPFLPGAGLTAQTVQAAVEEVYAALQHTAAGQIPDGTVTKEKLAAALLEKIYGGRVYVSADTPTAEQNPETDFPVGQLWLQPDFAVDDLSSDSWQTYGCTAEQEGTGWLLTADGSTNAVTAAQDLERVGSAGDTVQVLLTVGERSDHLTELTLYLNGVEFDLSEGGGLFETALDQTGSLELAVEGVWPYAESSAKVHLEQLAVVNADAVAAAHPGCRLPADWAALLTEYAPFSRLRLPRMLYQQTAAGVWTVIDREVLPVERGGTGKTAFSAGLLLYGDAGGGLTQLPAPAETDSLLEFADGQPRWVTRDSLLEQWGALRCKTGTYTGTGAERELDLGCEPKLLFLRLVDNTDSGNVSSRQEQLRLVSGEQVYSVSTVTWEFNGAEKKAKCYNRLRLQGGSLISRSTYENAEHTADNFVFNHAGESYQWTALY